MSHEPGFWLRSCICRTIVGKRRNVRRVQSRTSLHYIPSCVIQDMISVLVGRLHLWPTQLSGIDLQVDHMRCQLPHQFSTNQSLIILQSGRWRSTRNNVFLRSGGTMLEVGKRRTTRPARRVESWLERMFDPVEGSTTVQFNCCVGLKLEGLNLGQCMAPQSKFMKYQDRWGVGFLCSCTSESIANADSNTK